MDDLQQLQAKIPSYADYGNEDARHQVDKQIRAYLGEALSVARDRLAPDGPLGERLEGLILRCEFSDQRVIRAADHAEFGNGLAERVHALDLAIVQVADRIRNVASADELAAELDEAARLLDERFGAISDAPQHR
jgi:cell division protein ZapA (FtsZ GTPase activity inhibitor)